VTLLGAESLEHAAELLDQVDNAGECEVVPFDGELWLTMRPAGDPSHGLLVLDHRPTLEVDSQEEIVAHAFPVLHQLVVSAQLETPDGDVEDEPIDVAAWQAGSALENDRILAPSAEWKAAVERSWNELAPPATGDDD
jgi:hypothetical protein